MPVSRSCLHSELIGPAPLSTGVSSYEQRQDEREGFQKPEQPHGPYDPRAGGCRSGCHSRLRWRKLVRTGSTVRTSGCCVRVPPVPEGLATCLCRIPVYPAWTRRTWAVPWPYVLSGLWRLRFRPLLAVLESLLWLLSGVLLLCPVAAFCATTTVPD